MERYFTSWTDCCCTCESRGLIVVILIVKATQKRNYQRNFHGQAFDSSQLRCNNCEIRFSLNCVGYERRAGFYAFSEKIAKRTAQTVVFRKKFLSSTRLIDEWVTTMRLISDCSWRRIQGHLTSQSTNYWTINPECYLTKRTRCVVRGNCKQKRGDAWNAIPSTFVLICWQ